MKTVRILKFSNLDSEAHDLLIRMFNCREGEDGLLEIDPSGAILPTRYKYFGKDILEMEVRNPDVWLCSYPRTGSTWAQEMVWLIANDLDYEGSKKSLYEVIYTYRNPKDLVVSYYHYFNMVYKLNGTFDEFCDLFMKDHAPFGSFWSHLFAFWRRRNDPNVLLIKYEDMKRDLPSVVRRTAQFLNKELTDTQVDELCDHLSFKNMKTNRAVNFEDILEKTLGKSYLESMDLRHIRNGEIDDWKNYMSDDLSRRFDEWVEQKVKGTELSLK